jgi:hypothetical protein
MVRHFSFVGPNLGTAEIEIFYRYDFLTNPFLCFFFRSSSLFFPRHFPLVIPSSLSPPPLNEHTNKRENERKRTNNYSSLISASANLLAYHDQHFYFDFESATTVTKTMTKSMTTITTCPLLYIGQKGYFEIFKYEKQGKPLNFFFRALTSSIVGSIATALLKCTIPWPDPCIHFH